MPSATTSCFPIPTRDTSAPAVQFGRHQLEPIGRAIAVQVEYFPDTRSSGGRRVSWRAAPPGPRLKSVAGATEGDEVVEGLGGGRGSLGAYTGSCRRP
jgi:hypothetical protein